VIQTGQVLGTGDGAGVSWRISSYSSSADGSCVETSVVPDGTGRVAVRHSHHPDGLAVVFAHDTWVAFVGGVKKGELGLTLTAH
jgi:hypothetical protein